MKYKFNQKVCIRSEFYYLSPGLIIDYDYDPHRTNAQQYRYKIRMILPINTDPVDKWFWEYEIADEI